jgi:type II secretory pathway component GspD/PulD (secretin)
MVPIAALFAAAALGQNTEQALPLIHLDSPPSIQELTQILRIMPDMNDVSYDAGRHGFVVNGSSEQIALASWLVQQLDTPSGAQPPAHAPAYEYHPLPGRDAVNTAVRIFYLTHYLTPADLQEVQQVLRTGADVNRVFPMNEKHAMVARGTPEHIAMAEWLVEQLDQPAQEGRKTAAYEYRSPTGGGDGRAGAVRVVYLANLKTPAAMQEMMQIIRVGADVSRVFPFNSQRALVIRDAPARVALAEWLVAQTDLAAQPGRQPVSYEYRAPDLVPPAWALDGTARVYYPTHVTPDGMKSLIQELRNEARLNRVLPCHESQSLVIRGTAEQVAMADQLVAAADK